MTSDPRAALATLVAALETHLELSAVRRGENDPAVVTAYNKVADAFVAYDDALLDAYGEVTPLDVYSDEDDDFDEASAVSDSLDDQDDDEGDDSLDDDIAEDAQGDTGYVGLEDDEYDVDTGDDDADDEGDDDDDEGDDADDEDEDDEDHDEDDDDEDDDDEDDERD